MGFVDDGEIDVGQIAPRQGLSERTLISGVRVGQLMAALNDADVVEADRPKAIDGLPDEFEPRNDERDRSLPSTAWRMRDSPKSCMAMACSAMTVLPDPVGDITIGRMLPAASEDLIAVNAPS